MLLDDVLFLADDAKRLYLADEADRFGSLGAVPDVHALTLLDSTEPLRVVLTWTDYPSNPMAALNLVNDLHLEVESPSGDVFRGNVLTNGESQTGGAPDTLNTVELVHVALPEAGTWTVRVIPSTIPQPMQGYALVATGCFAAVPAAGETAIGVLVTLGSVCTCMALWALASPSSLREFIEVVWDAIETKTPAWGLRLIGALAVAIGAWIAWLGFAAL